MKYVAVLAVAILGGGILGMVFDYSPLTEFVIGGAWGACVAGYALTKGWL